jgi:transposase
VKTTVTRKPARPKGEVFIAIDLHAAHCVLGAMAQDGRWLGHQRFATTAQNLIAHVIAVPAKVKHIVIEECPMAQWVLGLLRPYCQTVLACDPMENRLVSRNAQKRDEIDVQSLCRLRRLNEVKEVYHTPDEDRFAFKAAVQYYLDLQKDRVRSKNKIKGIYARLGIWAPGESIYSAKDRSHYLSQVSHPVWLAALHRAYRRYDLLHKKANAALHDLERMGRSYPEIAIFQKIPGVGPVGACVFSAFLMTPHRFATASKLFRYCRLSVTDRSSDNKPLGYKRLERHGCPQLKSMSYHAWLGAISAQSDNEVKSFYEAALEYNGGNTKKARLSTQRKILTVMWTIWKKGCDYDPEEFIRPPMI